jgi:hypothetical protein
VLVLIFGEAANFLSVQKSGNRVSLPLTLPFEFLVFVHVATIGPAYGAQLLLRC